jgi:Cft2 family RNA processing exonuclease
VTATLTPISGVGSKGPACFLVEAAGARLLLDLGVGPQPGLFPDVSKVGRVDAVLLSHSHSDHAGGLKLLPEVGGPKVYATDCVRRLLPAGTESRNLPLHGTAEVCGVRVATGRNGHAPGGAWLHLEAGDGLLYMGDFSVESAVYAYDAPPTAATVILDASYGDYDTPLADAIGAFDRLFDAGPVLMPVPAAGRAADIAFHVFRTRGELPHIDTAVREALKALTNEGAESVRPEAGDDLATIARDASSIDGAAGVMLCGRGDADGGEAARLVSLWENARFPEIVFTGYLPPGTPAERLTRSGRARYMRWNVHPRLSDSRDLLRRTGARTVLPAFGDSRHLGTWQAAFAPAKVALQGPVAL